MCIQTLSDKAYHYIKDKVFASEKGRFLSVRELAAELGMSYTPVREAFQRLEREGLLERIPNVGFFVPQFDIRDVVEIFQVRECLEKFVLEQVFDQVTEEDLRTLSEYLDRQAECLDKGDIKGYVQLDEQFHMLFFRIYGNSYFIRLIRTVREQFAICSSKIARQGSPEAIQEHRKIVEYIRKGDKEQAVAVLVAHIENARQRMRDGYISLLE